MSAQNTHPTPYPDVNAVLLELLSGVQTILGNHFIGMYLYGSLASGDFDTSSDIDFLVVTDDELADSLFSALQATHARIASSGSKWAIELEGFYIPQRALRRYEPAQALSPHIERGHVLVNEQEDSGGVILRHLLRERGVVLTGPSPQTMIDPISPNDLRRAVLEILSKWWAPMLHAPARLQSRGYQSYAVLTMCRMLYTLEYGTIVSKPVAARWAQETFDARWIPLIERAWVGRDNSRLKSEPDDVNETREMIRYALECSQQFKIPTDEA